MKVLPQKAVVLIAIATGVLAASLAMAGVGNVSNTKHNFKVGGVSQVYTAQDGSGADQVCIFCHTPHNAGSAQLLWNKANNSTPSFRLYTSSKTLTAATRGSILLSDSPSLLCLGCHDGKTAMNILHSSSAGVLASGVPGATGYPAGSKLIPSSNYGATPLVMPAGQWNPLLEAYDPSMNLGMSGGDTTGLNLTDDHPIGFNYAAAAGADTGLHAIGVASSGGVRFFGPNNKVECSTCHDPHVDTSVTPDLKPFLVKSNVGSGLCLTCHNK